MRIRMLHEDTYAVSKLTIEIIDPNYVCYESFSRYPIRNDKLSRHSHV